jgi:hypothetical protein
MAATLPVRTHGRDLGVRQLVETVAGNLDRDRPASDAHGFADGQR